MWEVGALAEKLAFKDKDTTLNTNAQKSIKTEERVFMVFVKESRVTSDITGDVTS